MSCSSCSDGWVAIAADRWLRCNCSTERTRSEPVRAPFAGDYMPAGQTSRQMRRIRARKAGVASGVARRQRSTRKPPARARSRQEALALRYRIRQVSEAEFERLYVAMCERDGLPFDRRGLNSTLALYRAQVTAYRAQGQDYETTNSQAARALEKRGRARCRRTVQRLRKRLVAMGLIVYHHVKRSGSRRIPGQMDTLRVRLLCPGKANVTLPPGARAGLVPHPALALSESENKERTRTALSPPPPSSAAENEKPAPPAGTERGTEEAEELGEAAELERQLQFVELKLSIGFGDRERLENRRSELSHQLAGLGQSSDRSESITSAGFK